MLCILLSKLDICIKSVTILNILRIGGNNVLKALFFMIFEEIVNFFRMRKLRKCVDEFSFDDSGLGYQCPVCNMSNDTNCQCERCGFNPRSKTVTDEGERSVRFKF